MCRRRSKPDCIARTVVDGADFTLEEAVSCMPECLVLYFDGLCEPKNPGGVATYGYAIYSGVRKLCDGFGTVGAGIFGDDVSNNVAEYTAMIRGMEWLIAAGYTGRLTVRGDSQLTIRQMQGCYAVRAKRLAPLHEKAARLARRFERVEFEWVPRERNEEADGLSRKGFEAFLSEHGAEYRSHYNR